MFTKIVKKIIIINNLIIINVWGTLFLHTMCFDCYPTYQNDQTSMDILSHQQINGNYKIQHQHLFQQKLCIFMKCLI